MMYMQRPSRGLGAASTAGQAVAIGSSVGTPVLAGVLSSGASASAAAGGTGLILGMAPSLAIPVIGAAIAGVTILAEALIANSGCGPTCVQASDYANQAGALLDQNIWAYFSIPAPRTTSQQAAALANFDAIWAKLVQLCSDPQLGNAGKRCISDRQAGACTWHQTADKVPPWGTPKDGECWNWFNGQRDPIANDPDVVDDVTADGQAVAAAISSATGLSTGDLTKWGLVAALAVAAAWGASQL